MGDSQKLMTSFTNKGNQPNELSIDAVSLAGSYVAKSKLYRARSQGHTKRGNGKAVFYGHFTHNLEEEDKQLFSKPDVDSNIKVYIPK